MVSHAVWKTLPSGLGNDKNLGPCFSHSTGGHDQILHLILRRPNCHTTMTLHTCRLSLSKWHSFGVKRPADRCFTPTASYHDGNCFVYNTNFTTTLCVEFIMFARCHFLLKTTPASRINAVNSSRPPSAIWECQRWLITLIQAQIWKVPTLVVCPIHYP